MTDFDDRFWTKVDKTDSCWLWTAATDRGWGVYGLRLEGRWRKVYAHRFAYEALVGLIPRGLVIDHVCRVRRCVTPSHMDVVTLGENFTEVMPR